MIVMRVQSVFRVRQLMDTFTAADRTAVLQSLSAMVSKPAFIYRIKLLFLFFCRCFLPMPSHEVIYYSKSETVYVGDHR